MLSISFLEITKRNKIFENLDIVINTLNDFANQIASGSDNFNIYLQSNDLLLKYEKYIEYAISMTNTLDFKQILLDKFPNIHHDNNDNNNNNIKGTGFELFDTNETNIDAEIIRKNIDTRIKNEDLQSLLVNCISTIKDFVIEEINNVKKCVNDYINNLKHIVLTIKENTGLLSNIKNKLLLLIESNDKQYLLDPTDINDIHNIYEQMQKIMLSISNLIHHHNEIGLTYNTLYRTMMSNDTFNNLKKNYKHFDEHKNRFMIIHTIINKYYHTDTMQNFPYKFICFQTTKNCVDQWLDQSLLDTIDIDKLISKNDKYIKNLIQTLNKFCIAYNPKNFCTHCQCMSCISCRSCILLNVNENKMHENIIEQFIDENIIENNVVDVLKVVQYTLPIFSL
jgi:hypothetical protein